MKESPRKKPRALLSFHQTQVDFATSLASHLRQCGVEVMPDLWQGEHAKTQTAPIPLQNADVIVPLLSPTFMTPQWIGREWQECVWNPAEKQGSPVFPVLAAGDLQHVPDFLRGLSIARMDGAHRGLELDRLLRNMSDYLQDDSVILPEPSSSLLPSSPLDQDMGITLRFGKAIETCLEKPNPQNGTNIRAELGETGFPMMFDGLFYELGVTFPDISMLCDPALPPEQVQIELNGVTEDVFALKLDRILVNEKPEILRQQGMAAAAGRDPLRGMRWSWILPKDRDRAETLGHSSYDAQGYLIFRLSIKLRLRAGSFVNLAFTTTTLSRLKPILPKLIAETVPGRIDPLLLTDVLRRLVTDGVPITNMRPVLLSLCYWGALEQSPSLLTDYVRSDLKRQICHRFGQGQNSIPVFLLDPSIEEQISKAMVTTGRDYYLDMSPEESKALAETIQQAIARLDVNRQLPVILVPDAIRAATARLVRAFAAYLQVLSFGEMLPTIHLDPLGRITPNGVEWRKGMELNLN